VNIQHEVTDNNAVMSLCALWSELTFAGTMKRRINLMIGYRLSSILFAYD